MSWRSRAVQTCLLVLCSWSAAAELPTACQQLCAQLQDPRCEQLCWERISSGLNIATIEDPPERDGLAGPGEEGAYPNRDCKDTPGPEKRQKSAFVRIGRGPSSFVRIGRGAVPQGLIQEQDLPEDDLMPYPHGISPHDKRTSSFVRIGKSLGDGEKRASSFVRIGKSLAGEQDLINAEAAQKRASNFVRIGRASQFVRIGRDYPKRISSFVRIGKRPSSFVRIGKKNVLNALPYETYELAESPESQKRASSFVRIGRSGDKRTSSFVRIGKSPQDEQGKRASSFVRIGKSSSDEEDGKRASSFVRIGKSPEPENDKRASSFVRIGKASSFVRIGKPDHSEADKRASNFVRIGKSLGWPMDSEEVVEDQSNSNSGQKRSSFLRIGRGDMTTNDAQGER